MVNSMRVGGVKVVAHPLLPMYNTRVRYGVGGYKGRWNVRIVERVVCQEVYFVPLMNTVYVSLEHFEMLKQFKID